MKPIHYILYFIISILMSFYPCYGANITIINQVFTTPVSYTIYDTVIIKNCSFHNIAGNALTCYNTQYLRIDSCHFSNVSTYAVHIRSAKYVLIQNSSFNNIGKGLRIGRESQNIFTHSADNATYRVDSLFMINNIIKNINDTGVRILNTAFIDFNNNRIDSCLLGGIILGSNVGVEPCSLWELNPVLNDVRSETRIYGCHIRNNVILHTLGDGIGTLENVYGAKILNNEIAYVAYDGTGARPANGDHGMYLQGPDALVEGNYIHHILDDYETSIGQGSGISFRSTATINKNIIHNCINSGIAYFNDHPGGIQDIFITNNVVYDNQRTAIYINPGCPESAPDSVHIYHNTVIGQPVQNLWHEACPVGFNNYTGYKNVIGNILIYEGIMNTSHFIFNGIGAINDLHNIKNSTDIGFLNFTERDMRLSFSSSAIDFLPSLYNLVSDDILGNSRTLPADAGAYEYYFPVIVRDTGTMFYTITLIDSLQTHDTVVIHQTPGIMDTLVISSQMTICDTLSTTTVSVADSLTFSTQDTLFVTYTFLIYDSIYIHCTVSVVDSIFIPEVFSKTTENLNTENWFIYPNPGNGYLFLKQTGDTYATKVTLCDSRGRHLDVVQLWGSTSVIDFSSTRSPGVYFLILQGERFSITKKIVIVPDQY